MTVVALVQCEWWYIDAEGSVAYRSCDICYQSATEDACAGKRIQEFRQFCQEITDDGPGIVVCEHCLDACLAEKP